MHSLAAVVLALFFSTSAFAQAQRFVVDPAASQVHIRLNTNHEVVNGTFHVESGSIRFDRAGRAMSGLVTVAAGSGATGNSLRDKRMHHEILKSNRFTTICFAPESYTGTLAASGDSTIQVKGAFTLLGTPHILVIPMQVHIQGASATADATFLIPYVQWGLKNPSFLFWKADTDVSVTLALAGTLAADSAPQPPPS